MKKQEVMVVADSEDLIPVYASSQAAGADLRANIEKEIELFPGESLLLPTGIKVEIPYGYEIQIRPRSGLALKNQITILNSPGTIDADYRGEIGVILINHGKKSFLIKPRMRIAQMVLAEVNQALFVSLKDAKELANSARGNGGFGHSGLE